MTRMGNGEEVMARNIFDVTSLISNCLYPFTKTQPLGFVIEAVSHNRQGLVTEACNPSYSRS